MFTVLGGEGYFRVNANHRLILEHYNKIKMVFVDQFSDFLVANHLITSNNPNILPLSTLKNKNKKKSINVTYEQKQLLIDFVHKHPKLNTQK